MLSAAGENSDMPSSTQKDSRTSDETALTALFKRQPLGILPSARFWREIWRTEPQLQLYFTLLWAILVAPFIFLCIVYLQPTWLSAISVFLISILGGGAIEKLLRFLVVRRRRLMAARPRDDRGDG